MKVVLRAPWHTTSPLALGLVPRDMSLATLKFPYANGDGDVYVVKFSNESAQVGAILDVTYRVRSLSVRISDGAFPVRFVIRRLAIRQPSRRISPNVNRLAQPTNLPCHLE